MKIKRYILPLLVIAVLAVAGLTAPANVAAEELVKIKIVDANSIPDSLTGKAGDPVKGRALAITAKRAIAWPATHCRCRSSPITARWARI